MFISADRLASLKKKLTPPFISPDLLRSSWSMSWPTIVIMLFEFIMSMTDIYISGRYGPEVKAAVGLSLQIYNFFLMAGHAIVMGSTSVVSRLFTAGDMEKYRSAAFTSIIFSFSFSILIALIAITFSQNILSLLNAPDEVKQYASPLIRIYFLGIVFHMLVIAINGVLRSSGRIRVTMGVMILSTTLNFSLLQIFYHFTSLGFRSIAISTAISMTVACILDIKFILEILQRTFIFSKEYFKKILSIGWPAAIVSFTWNFGGTVLYAILAMLGDYSVTAMAAFATGIRIESAIFMPAFAFSMANAILVGNLLGSKKLHVAFTTGLTTAFMSVFVISILTVIIILNAEGIARLLEPNEEVVKEIVKYLYICIIVEPFAAWNLSMGGALNGSGDTKHTMLYALLNVWVCRLPLAYILGIALGYGTTGIWWALNIGFFLQVILSTRRFLSKKWQHINI